MPPTSPSSWLCLPLLAAAALLAGCDALEAFPRDPEGTLERVRGGTLRAGILHAPPWVEALDEPRGPEAEIVRTLARELDAEVLWVRGAPDQLLLLLEEHELDLLRGALARAREGRQNAPLVPHGLVACGAGGRAESRERGGDGAPRPCRGARPGGGRHARSW